MKRIITIAIACIICFTACKKDSENMAVTPAGNSNSAYAKDMAQSNIPGFAVFSYGLAAPLPSGNELFQWNSGYITVNAITFDGGVMTGNMVKQEHDLIAVNNKRIVLAPAAAAAVAQLGNMNLQFNKYISPSFGLSLGTAPGNNPQVNAASLYLTGTVSLNDGKIPVILTIDQLTQLTANAGDLIILSPDKGNYSASLSLNLNELVAGIDPVTLNNGQRTNGVMLISATTNQNLYNTMLNNFKSNTLSVRLNGEIAPPPVATNSGTILSAPPAVQ